MKIHFMAAADGNKDDYANIISIMRNLGHDVITDHILSRDLTEIDKETPAEAELAAKKMQNWIKSADIVVFETTKRDISVGFDVAVALNYGKSVIILYRNDVGVAPHGLRGIHADKLQILGYDKTTIAEMLKLAVEYAQDTVDTRFNFFISPSVSHYLDWIAQSKKIPRSVYLRQLIEEDREKHAEEYGAA